MINNESDRIMSVTSTGDVSGVGIAIGHGSSASVKISEPNLRVGLTVELEKFIYLLERYNSEMPDASTVRESVMEVQSEIEKPSPRWAIVRALIAGIKAGVANVATLTEAINNIQTLIGHAAK